MDHEAQSNHSLDLHISQRNEREITIKNKTYHLDCWIERYFLRDDSLVVFTNHGFVFIDLKQEKITKFVPSEVGRDDILEGQPSNEEITIHQDEYVIISDFKGNFREMYKINHSFALRKIIVTPTHVVIKSCPGTTVRIDIHCRKSKEQFVGKIWEKSFPEKDKSKKIEHYTLCRPVCIFDDIFQPSLTVIDYYNGGSYLEVGEKEFTFINSDEERETFELPSAHNECKIVSPYFTLNNITLDKIPAFYTKSYQKYLEVQKRIKIGEEIKTRN